MGPLGKGLLRGHGDHVHLAARIGQEHDDALPQLGFKLVAQVAQAVHVHIVHAGRQELHALHLHHIVHHISQGFLGRLGLQGLQLGGQRLHLRRHMLDLLHQRGRGGAKRPCRLLDGLLQPFIIGKHAVPRQGLDPADTCRDAVLGQDFEGRDDAGIGHMGAAAELHGKVSHLHHPDLLAVLLAEEGHGPGLPGILDAHHLRHYREIGRNLLIDDFLHPVQLFLGHGREMAEIEAQPLPVHVGAGLLHMAAQHLPESLVQQMGGAVVLAGVAPLCGIHRERGRISHLEHALGDNADVAYLAAQELYGIPHLEAAVRRGDDACVCILAAHGGIERSLLHDDRTGLAVRQGLHQLALRGQHGNLGIMPKPVIAYEPSGDGRIDGLVHRHVRSHVIGGLAGFPGRLPLMLHAHAKARLIHGEALLLQNLLGQVRGEPESVVQLEGVLPGELRGSRRFHLLFHLGQDAQALVDGLVELVLLLGEDIQDKGPLLLQLGIPVLALIDHGLA